MALNDVFWLDRPRPATRPTLVTAEQADVVIVGGGFTGLWSALALLEQQPSLRVVLLEATSLGAGASGRNGGFLDRSLTHGLSNGVRHFPAEIGRLEDLAADNYAGLRSALERYGVDCHFEPSGMLEVATQPWHVDELREWAQLHREHGQDAEWLDADQAREHVNSPLVRGAVRRPEAGGVLDPVLLVDGLAAAAQRLGAVVYEHSPVTSIERTAGGVTVRTASGSVEAGHAVIAADSWTRELLPRSRRHYINVYDYVLVTEPLDAAALDAIGWKNREGISDAGNRFHYFRLTADDRILWGGYDAVRHRRDAVGDQFDHWPPTHQKLEAHFRAFFPQLAGVQFTHRWGGPIAVTSRFTPVFGAAMAGRAHYALGYTGLGIAASRFAGRVLAAKALGDKAFGDMASSADHEVAALAYVRRAPLPFPPEPLRSLVVGATQRAITNADTHAGRRGPWLRLLDRVGVGLDS